jgi:hypothetical protein
MRQILYLRSPEIRERACAAIRLAPDGYRVEIKEPTRSLDQNAKLWAMLNDVSEQVVWYGTKLSSDDWKTIFTASLRKTRVVPGIDTGSFVPVGMSTSKMTKSELSDLLELIGAFGAEHDVKWSDPKEVKNG